jgi:hypothetical protein
VCVAVGGGKELEGIKKKKKNKKKKKDDKGSAYK